MGDSTQNALIVLTLASTIIGTAASLIYISNQLANTNRRLNTVEGRIYGMRPAQGDQHGQR
jgi:hypothetical protein